MEHRCKNNYRENQITKEKPVPLHLVHRKPHMDCLGVKPSLQDKRLVSIHLSNAQTYICLTVSEFIL
jgi:hypothetical protein